MIPARFWLVKGAGPAQYPHDCLESAEREADRLARSNPGKIFYVMESVLAFQKVDVERIDLRPSDDGDIPF